MTLNDLMILVDETLDGCDLSPCWDPVQQQPLWNHEGAGVAYTIVSAIAHTYQPGLSDREQLRQAVKEIQELIMLLKDARDDIRMIIAALSR